MNQNISLDQLRLTARKYSRSIERISSLQRAAIDAGDADAVEDHQTALDVLREQYRSTLRAIKMQPVEVPE